MIYETHKNAMYTGFGLIVGFYILAEILLRVVTPTPRGSLHAEQIGDAGAVPWCSCRTAARPT